MAPCLTISAFCASVLLLTGEILRTCTKLLLRTFDKSAKMTTHSIHNQLIADLNQMLLHDPIMKALWQGTMKWGDIPGIIHPRRASLASVASDASDESVASDASEECDLTRIYHPKQNKPSYDPTPALKPVQKRSVPPFPAGRSTLMAKNLPRDITIQHLRSVFELYGPIRDIYIPKNMDRSSQYYGTIKGFAKIQFLTPDDASDAYTHLYGTLTIANKHIAIEFANEDRTQRADDRTQRADDTEKPLHTVRTERTQYTQSTESTERPQYNQRIERTERPQYKEKTQYNHKTDTIQRVYYIDNKQWFLDDDGTLIDKNGMPYGF